MSAGAAGAPTGDGEGGTAAEAPAAPAALVFSARDDDQGWGSDGEEGLVGPIGGPEEGEDPDGPTPR